MLMIKQLDSTISGIRIATSNNSEKGTELSESEFLYSDILIDSVVIIKGIKFTINNMQDSVINFFINDGLVQCVSNFDLNLTNMLASTQSNTYVAGTVFEVQPMTLITINDYRFNLVDFIFTKQYKSYSTSKNMNFRDNPYRKQDELVLMVKVEVNKKKLD